MAEQYTMDQLNTLVENQFKKHDANGDDKLDKTEAHALFQEVHGKFGDKPWTEDGFEAAFAKADSDGDGFIQKPELHAFLHNWAKNKNLMKE